MKQYDANFYPGWTRKAISFTIDDGNLAMDEKFLSYVRPAGILGTFNLTTPLKAELSHADYRHFYRGYEIANHTRRHPHAFSANRNPTITDAPFDAETADKTLAYKTEEEGLYRIFARHWNYFLAEDEKYLAMADDCTKELNEAFGEGTVKDFVWPFGDQNNENVMEGLIALGFRSIRKTGDVADSTGFALPEDRMHWSYNAHNATLLRIAPLFAAYPDDGELKLFCFGVHSYDFERDNNWDDLASFCRDYGNRPEKYWYAAMGDIFDYQDAVRALTVKDDVLFNDSDVDLFIHLDGERYRLCAHTSVSLQ